jgi:asparagine synthetase B (glutamine-hydrolysing)
MSEALDPHFMNGDYSREFVDRFFNRAGGTRPVDKALQLDTEIMLVDDPVKRVDNMTMAWGLEGRVPFLDHEVVELAARIPAELKVSRGGKSPRTSSTGPRATSLCRRSNTYADHFWSSFATCCMTTGPVNVGSSTPLTSTSFSRTLNTS